MQPAAVAYAQHVLWLVQLQLLCQCAPANQGMQIQHAIDACCIELELSIQRDMHCICCVRAVCKTAQIMCMQVTSACNQAMCAIQCTRKKISGLNDMQHEQDCQVVDVAPHCMQLTACQCLQVLLLTLISCSRSTAVLAAVAAPTA